MKFLFILLFLPLYSLAQTGDQLTGLWVRTKVQRGSTPATNGFGGDFLKYNFAGDGSVNRSTNVLFDEFRLLYKLNGDALQIGGVFFHIIKMDPDTLIMSPNNGRQNEIYTLLKVHDLKTSSEEKFDPALKDSVFKANPLLFPQCNSEFHDFLGTINANPDTGQLKISFVINKKGKLKSYIVLANNGVSSNLAKSITNSVSNLEWTPAQMNSQPVNCLVTIDLHFAKLMRGGEPVGYLEINYPFLKVTPDPRQNK
jgi:hypothetical protein